MGLSFLPRRPPPDSRKRGRAVADIDGEHSCLQKKKRRLRLFLITSRLSPQFSHPATNIADRGSSKIAVWAKQKALGRSLLRKAAILNRIRRRTVSAREAGEGRGRVLVQQEKEECQFEMARLTFQYGSIDTYTRPVHSQTQSAPPSATIRSGGHIHVSVSPTKSTSHSPKASRSPSPTSLSSPLRDNLPEYRSPNAAYALSPPRTHSSKRDHEPLLPSPLGLSNYDAFDAEDDAVTDPYSHLDDDDESYSYLWNEDESERHDSPFSPSVVTNDSRTTANTGLSQILTTPPRLAYDDFDNASKVTESLLAGFDEADEAADSVWPSPYISATSKPSATPQHGIVSPSRRVFDTKSMAVQPVERSFSSDVNAMTTSRAGSPNLAPAAMSPNFLPADYTWPGGI
ncbi:hypothetical protein N0V94_005779 [Neodidymelliopsis sp. IMI 364377]|nr:hypothetical protein N0V94_005779 [Neodidymelliopsis sp. IMI 364377]